MSDFKNNLTSDAFWLRTLFIVAFFIVYRVSDVVLMLLTVAQWLFQLFTGKVNESLAGFGDSLGRYVQQIVAYLSGASEEKPYPFQEWPTSQSDSE